MTYGNGKSTTLTYDDRARAKTVMSSGVIGLTYGYDGADNILTFNNTAVPNSSRTMEYTKLDQLASTTALSLWGRADYDYDELGNRIMKSTGAYTTIYTYDSQNRLASATGGAAPIHGMILTWDLAGRLESSSDGVHYRYDGLGRRIAKIEPSGTTLYHYDAFGRLISETSLTGARLRDYIYLGNKLVAIEGCITVSPPAACIERQWYHTDVAGSVLARSDSAGNVERFDYQPWGEQWTAPSTAAGDRQYNGRIFDANTGFHDYGARMYWPEIGRFISVDTGGPSAAVPATFNRYAYVLNNPYKYVDPNGKWPKEIHNQIITKALEDLLSPGQLQILMDASAYVDRWTSIFSGSNDEHAMRSSDEKPDDARKAIDTRISNMSAYARMLQGTTPGSLAGLNSEALNIFGQGGAHCNGQDITSSY